MTLIELLGTLARMLFQALEVSAPLLVWQWVIVLGRPWRGVARVTDATIIGGAMVGAAAVPLVIPSMALGWNAVVTPGGVWDLTLADFQTGALHFVWLAVPRLLDGLRTDDPAYDLHAWLMLAIVLWMLRIAMALSLGRGRGVPRLLAAEIVTFLASLYGTVYLAPLLLWSVNQLNFWLLLILIFLIQDWRHNEPPLLSRLFAGLTGIATLRRPVIRVVN